ncbi:MAG: FG-GAP-like repeat-containing protein [Verrucomicrobiia bacterium]
MNNSNDFSTGHPTQLVLLALAHGFLVLAAAPAGLAQPAIIKQPESLSVSLGAGATFGVTASATSPPLAYQWRHNDTAISGATTSKLSITNAQLANAGAYTVFVSDAAGSVTSQPAILDVDPTFTKITTGEIVTDKRHWHGQTWGDFDNDGDLDLFMVTTESSWNPIYVNNGDGTFTRRIERSLQGLHQNDKWFFNSADYDNDGHLDLLFPDFSAFYGANNKTVLMHNDGSGGFTRVTDNPMVKSGAVCTSGGWGDYDQDGDLDLLMANGGFVGRAMTNCFYENQGDGSFVGLVNDTVLPLLTERDPFMAAAWVDVNDDGWTDLLFLTGRIRLFLNTGAGAYAKVTTGSLVTESGMWSAMAWADYDNDGDLDLLLVSNGYPTLTRPLALFRNDGGGEFRKMTAADIGPLATEQANSFACAWGDFDNDGWIDLIVANGWYQSERRTPLFYRNQGDGTFAKVTRGSPAKETGASMVANWVDYDQDGALDLFLTDHDEGTTWANRLFRNNGNGHAWLEVKCVGTCSPRWGTGAKIRVKTSIAGKEQRQLRLIDSGGTAWGGQSYVAHFGLGTASIVDTLRIEWPSGIVQELRTVPVNQVLTVTEPSRLEMTQPGTVKVSCWKSQVAKVETSTDLVQWQSLTTLTNATGRLECQDPASATRPASFYRAEVNLR